ncbi:MAG: hypothetical protein HN742_13370 [Lentisphaerae bacterium]|jgi:hypothetical protein|nr:hypothetical protein [Lentisphaerota bacterium]MBT4820887.1 hypothetical protein [Lentisphaerota bacterium]MBT5608204.1 hypothetical protein [Lentisphaerota bacterium]MBT7058907.1 hypothetical protein [Lentisphaerota bacterium]MBT7842862.1 hypothetical protein [Lentisphaerota bacterium]
MPPRRSTEDVLAELSRLEATGLDDELLAPLKSASAGANNIVIAKVARIAERRNLIDLSEPLIAAFARLMRDPAKKDKGCRALTDIARALDALGSRDSAVFLQGIAHVQMEPVYGGRVDTAAMLRATCALGLARLYHPDAALHLTHLLVDPEPQPRGAAARGLGYLGGEQAELLLRLKVLNGDEDNEVLGECFSSLLAVSPERSVPFVTGYLAAEKTDVAESAALALGECGRDDAYRALMAHWDSTIKATERARLALPIALTKRPEARDFLLDVVRESSALLAKAAIDALRIFRWDAPFVDQLHRVVELRNSRELAHALSSWAEE